MIIVAPQLNDWKETSARQTIALTRYFLGHYNIETIALTRYFLGHYNIDPQKVYLNGYSGGGGSFAHEADIMSWLFGEH